MPWCTEDFVPACNLNNLPKIHHGNLVANLRDNRQIVRNKQVRQVELCLQIRKQIDHLSLNRHIQSRNSLIRDDQARFQNQCARCQCVVADHRKTHSQISAYRSREDRPCEKYRQRCPVPRCPFSIRALSRLRQQSCQNASGPSTVRAS